MIEILSFDFAQNAIIASLLLSVCVGIIGTLVVINKMSFVASGIAHGAYGGVGIAFFAGFSPNLGALGFGLILSVLIAYFSFNERGRFDSVIGAIWAFGMAVGVIFADLSDKMNVDLMSYLFGSILAVPKSDLYIIAGLDVLILCFIGLFYRAICAASFDSEFALLRGVSTRALYYAQSVFMGLCVVVSIRLVGLVMVIALLTITPYIAEKFSKNLALMMALSTAFSALFCLGGLGLAFYFDLTSGASIILLASLAFFLMKILKD